MPSSSAMASRGTLNRMRPMKRHQVAMSDLDPSSTVPVSEVNLAPQARQRQRWTPPAVLPSLKGEAARQEGQAGSVR